MERYNYAVSGRSFTVVRRLPPGAAPGSSMPVRPRVSVVPESRSMPTACASSPVTSVQAPQGPSPTQLLRNGWRKATERFNENTVNAEELICSKLGGQVIMNHLRNVRDESMVPRSIRHALVRVMANYLMLNCETKAFPTWDERVALILTFLSQLPVAFSPIPFAKTRGLVDKRIKYTRRNDRVDKAIQLGTITVSVPGEREMAKRDAESREEPDNDNALGAVEEMGLSAGRLLQILNQCLRS